MTYVNEAKIMAWYESVAKEPRLSASALLEDVRLSMISTGKSEYFLPADKTITGKAESYRFRFVNIGACGASTSYIYF